ncbi:hypothetical protein FYJ24_11940 [Actinomycetaceae bacterium WB03_NA08]|uniref:Uncharacterized protein n=1 Tax=Scrofimicrobium canadense TaxID=2652290 RepID=A0A6N7VUH0_9ACTO|nr:helix-turn-helix domain-containing protein [Scrofimicrobium canadense]MSS85439.1 hypothetical protein [Scrofimicrobium canadense]
MTTIEARAVRDDGWWVVTVPIAGRQRATQGRTLKQAELMVRELVSLWAEELEDEELASANVVLTAVGDTQETVDAVRTAQAAAEEAAAAARVAQRSAVALLRAQGMTMQDIARLMGITKGRVNQLTKA